MSYLISGPRIKSYRARQDVQSIDRRRGWKRLSRVLALFLALAVIAVASPAHQFRLRLEPRRRISELESLRKQRGWNDPVVKKKLKEAQADFGVSSSLLRPHRILRPQGLDSDVPFSSAHKQWPGSSLDPDSQSAHIQDAQTRLSELGHLDANVDVDGKIGPRTRRALSQFQTERGLLVTGRLDSATEEALGLKPLRGTLEGLAGETPIGQPEAPQSDFYINVPARLVLEDLKASLSAKYRLLDASGDVLYRGDDQGELATKLNESLSDGSRRSIYVEMKGFSEDKAEALASSLRIQQHQIDPAVSIGVLPHFDENLALHQNLFTSGIRLEGKWAPFERIDSGKDAGKFRTSHPVARGLRHFTVTMVGATVELLQELVEIFENLLPTEILENLLPTRRFGERQSLSQHVERTLRDLMKRHPGLTNEQFSIEVTDQFGSIRIGELNRSVLFAWS